MPIAVESSFRLTEVSVGGFGVQLRGSSRPGDGIPATQRNRSLSVERARDVALREDHRPQRPRGNSFTVCMGRNLNG